MLYHDVWKVGQYSAYEKSLSRDEIREILAWPLNHRVSWPELAKSDFARLTFSKSTSIVLLYSLLIPVALVIKPTLLSLNKSKNEIKTICRYILNHHVPGEILNANEENRTKKMRKLYSEVWFDMVNNLLDITIADRLWQFNPMQNSADITDVEELRSILIQLQKEEWQFTQKNLAVNWKKIMDYFNISSWPKVWELLSLAMNWVLVDVKNRNNEVEIFWYLKWIIKNTNLL